MATPNPLTHPGWEIPAISKITIPIGGLFVDIYGLSELPQTARAVSCLWLHHPRLRVKEDMAAFGCIAVSSWHARQSATRGLIAVAYDQRNHGTRLIQDEANGSWRDGNKTHAQDMFSAIRGMVIDQELLLDSLEGYIFGNGYGPGKRADGKPRNIDQHLALGVSLGGHSVWQTLFAEPRVTAGVIVIGCPDYMALMSDRARKSRLATFSATDNGASFLGSADFPDALVRACQKYDPKGITFGTGTVATPPSPEEKARLAKIFDSSVHGKKFMVLSGGADKLVPYEHLKPFLDFFQDAVDTWYKEAGTTLENIVYPNVGHLFSPDMQKDAVRFLIDAVSQADGKAAPSAKI
ncbi:Alpha/Beta hydrolase protein [Xylariales sp. PMI_506]|nr:Alpha/Beta hydrolase protein [Xylariales sp. PMI_506]